MTDEEKAYARWCVDNDTHKFYTWGKWLAKREEVLKMDRRECQRCRHKYKRYTEATTVHHVNHLKKRPELALEIFYEDIVAHKTRRNLISLCHDCHEEVHGYRKKNEADPLTEERWD